MSAEQVLARIEALPEKSRRVVLAVVDALAEQGPEAQVPRPLRFDWEGGLAEAFPGMTAVELQHKASEWR